MRPLFVVALLAMASALPGQRPNLEFGYGTVVMPISWNGQPAFLIAASSGSEFIEFLDPHAAWCTDCVDVVLRPHLFGAIDGRECVDDPVQPTLVGYGPEPSMLPRNRVRRGVNLWTEWYEKRWNLSYLPGDSDGMGHAHWYLGCNSPLGYMTACPAPPLAPELAFLIVTVELR